MASSKLPVANVANEQILRKWKVPLRVFFLKVWKSQHVETHFQWEDHASGDFRRSVRIIRWSSCAGAVRIPGYSRYVTLPRQVSDCVSRCGFCTHLKHVDISCRGIRSFSLFFFLSLRSLKHYTLVI